MFVQTYIYKEFDLNYLWFNTVYERTTLYIMLFFHMDTLKIDLYDFLFALFFFFIRSKLTLQTVLPIFNITCFSVTFNKYLNGNHDLTRAGHPIIITIINSFPYLYLEIWKGGNSILELSLFR
jgi:hypothetical protein